MVPPVSAVSAVQGIVAPGAAATGASGGSGFQDVFEKAVAGVENLRQTADQQVESFLTGEGGELHSMVVATQKADLAFELFLQVRNKVVSAYQEIMRMQI
jgi:flagellar hook-basal body complex protein FliE